MIPETDMHQLKSLSRAVRGGTLDVLRLAERAYRMGFECHASVVPVFNPETFNLDELERATLKKAIERTGSVVAASRLMGIGKTTAYRKVKEYGLA
jgi:transcriptional regulator of acetoin/glycerol metabolism